MIRHVTGDQEPLAGEARGAADRATSSKINATEMYCALYFPVVKDTKYFCAHIYTLNRRAIKKKKMKNGVAVKRTKCDNPRVTAFPERRGSIFSLPNLG